jgi:hypothetical protein
MAAAEFAAQIRIGDSDLNVSPSVLYALAAGAYHPKVAAKILKAAKERRVDDYMAAAFSAEQRKRTEITAEEERIEDEQQQKLAEQFEEEQQRLERQRLKEEAEAILDGPPPDLPPPEPVPLETDKYLHQKLAALVVDLKKLATKPTDRFAASGIEPSDLHTVCDFLKQVAAKIVSRRAA